MSLYKRIDTIAEKIEKGKKLKEYFKDAPKAPDTELLEREKRALQHLMDTLDDHLEEVCEVLKVGKEFIDAYDLSNIPPSISKTGFRGIPLLDGVVKAEEESFIIALLANGDFVKFTCQFSKKTKAFENFKAEPIDVEDVIKMVTCEEIVTSVEKEVKGYEKRILESKPSNIKRQEFLIKIGG